MLELLVQQAIGKVLRDYENFCEVDLKKQVVKEFTIQLYGLDERSLLTEITDILYSEKQKEKNFTNTNLHV